MRHVTLLLELNIQKRKKNWIVCKEGKKKNVDKSQPRWDSIDIKLILQVSASGWIPWDVLLSIFHHLWNKWLPFSWSGLWFTSKKNARHAMWYTGFQFHGASKILAPVPRQATTDTDFVNCFLFIGSQCKASKGICNAFSSRVMHASKYAGCSRKQRLR